PGFGFSPGLVLRNFVTCALDELADFVGPSTAEDAAVFVFVALSVFLETRKESQAANAAFYNAGAFLENDAVVFLVVFVLGDAGINESERLGHEGLKFVFGDAVGDFSRPI